MCPGRQYKYYPIKCDQINNLGSMCKKCGFMIDFYEGDLSDILISEDTPKINPS